MKKGMMALSLALIVGLFSTFAYADGSLDGKDLYGDTGNVHNRPWGEDLLQYEETYLKKAIEENRITEESKTGEEHYKYVDEFYEENGYLNNHCGDGPNQGHRRGMGRNHMGW